MQCARPVSQRCSMQVNPNIKKEKWSPAEDDRLLVLYEEHGGSWAQISRHLEVTFPAMIYCIICCLFLCSLLKPLAGCQRQKVN